MICRGELTKDTFTKATKFITVNSREIFFGYKNDIMSNKLTISGCEGQYNYTGITEHLKGSSVFTLTESGKTVLKVQRGGGLSLKAEIVEYDRDLNVKFNIGLGTIKLSIFENKKELASLLLKNKAYTLEVNDDENPTLISSILVGVTEINRLTNMLYGK